MAESPFKTPMAYMMEYSRIWAIGKSILYYYLVMMWQMRWLDYGKIHSLMVIVHSAWHLIHMSLYGRYIWCLCFSMSLGIWFQSSDASNSKILRDTGVIKLIYLQPRSGGKFTSLSGCSWRKKGGVLEFCPRTTNRGWPCYHAILIFKICTCTKVFNFE